MRSKLLFLMLVAGLLVQSATVRAGINFVPNPVFELDEAQQENLTVRAFSDIYDWNQWGDAALAASDHPDFPLHAETGISSIWNQDPVTGTVPLMKANTVYFVECDIKAMPGSPLPAQAGLIFETMPDNLNDVQIRVVAPNTGWVRVGASLDTSDPANAVYIGKPVSVSVRSDAEMFDRFNDGRSDVEGFNGDTYVAVTNIYFGEGRSDSSPIHTPYPPDNTNTGFSPTLTELSWIREIIVDSAGRFVAGMPEVEIYWGTQDDPNFWGWTGGDGELAGGGEPVKIMALADANDFDLADAIGGPITLAANNYYYWAAKYVDPNDGNFGVPELVKNDTWSFDTFNRPPVVDAGRHYDIWMESGDPAVTIDLEATVTDDGLPLGGNVTYTWTADPCSNITFTPSANVEDPNITVTAADDYLLTLTVHDDEGGADDEFDSDSTLVKIISNTDDRLRAHYALDSDPCDSAGGHDGTLHDDPVWQPVGGQVAGAIELDGTDDVGTDNLGDHVSIDDTGSDPNWQDDTWENSDLIDGMTIYAWMKLDEDGWSKSWESVVSKSTDSWELLRAGSGSDVNFAVKGNVGAAGSAGTDVTSGWHQVAGVFDRNTVKFYVDGLQTESTVAGATQAPKSAGKILIGNTNNPSVKPKPPLTRSDFSFGGRIDQVRIFDAAVPHRAEHSNTPGIVELFRADGGHNSCGDERVPGDLNDDCYVTLGDFALVAKDWLECNNIADASCD